MTFGAWTDDSICGDCVPAEGAGVPNGAPRLTDTPPPGWLFVDAGGTIRRADAAACALLGLSSTGSVLGRDPRSLLTRGDRACWPDPWPGPGASWAGTLHFEVTDVIVTLATEVVGLASGEGWTVRLAVAPGSPDPALASAVAPPAPAEAPLAAADALEDSDSPAAAARAVLQALDAAMPLDFACVLRFNGQATTVVAVYPSSMAGIAVGDTWTQLDEAEALVRERGEPSLEGDLTVARESGVARTPLGRLPAFGLRSQIQIPLFVGAKIAGAALLYRRSARAFSAADGWLAERTLRRLGARLDGPVSHTGAATQLPGQDTDAVARFDALGDLVAGAAHELNNPLTSILGYAQILDSLEGTDREHALRTIEEESQRAARIMRNLLQFARQEPEPLTPPAGVQLPLVSDPLVRTVALTPEAHDPDSGIAPRPVTARLLIVDSDPAIRSLTSEALSNAGYHVTVAPNAAEGVERLRGGQYDAVIASHPMRGMDAAALTAWIAAHTYELSDRIIFVTNDIEAERAAVPPGVTARYLQKPFDVVTLLSAVRSLLNDHPAGV